MLSVEKLSKTFSNNVVAIDNVSFKVDSGEFIVLLGPSGAGKTTFLRAINGLVVPDSGLISLNGNVISNQQDRAYRQKFGMIFQHYNLVENLSVINNVLAGALTKANTFLSWLYLFPKDLKLQALKCLERVELLDKVYERASNISGGQKQRVGIARAIMQEPLVILADEPIANLDPLIAYNILSLLKEICRKNNIAVICNLHQVDFALQFADRILCLADGRIVLNEDAGKLNPEIIHQAYKGENQTMFSEIRDKSEQ